mmetsp:Transcript_35624/g.74827  ORF Transcript_35624/g.74827 Transcript_35624/m.74827 type:complete len:141 (+) Transcript_35624:1041-1463(+)
MELGSVFRAIESALLMAVKRFIRSVIASTINSDAGFLVSISKTVEKDDIGTSLRNRSFLFFGNRDTLPDFKDANRCDSLPKDSIDFISLWSTYRTDCCCGHEDQCFCCCRCDDLNQSIVDSFIYSQNEIDSVCQEFFSLH